MKLNGGLKFLKAWRDAKGRLRYRFRKPGHPEVMLHGELDSPEFMAQYHAALAGKPMPVQVGVGASRTIAGSLNDLIARYYAAPAFKLSAPATQADQRSVLERMRIVAGDRPLSGLDRAFIKSNVADCATRHIAKHWLKAVRAVLKYAIAIEMICEDPSEGVKPPQPVRNKDGYHTWTEDEIAQYQTAHKIGTRERLACDLLLFTGQRRSDVIRISRRHIKGGVLQLSQVKTGVEVSMPLHPDLVASLKASGAMEHELKPFLLAPRGKPYLGNWFTADFKKWVRAAGLPDRCTPHGLRKAFCSRLASLGVSGHDIMACSGHTTLSELERYTKKYERRKGSARAMAALVAASVPAAAEA